VAVFGGWAVFGRGGVCWPECQNLPPHISNNDVMRPHRHPAQSSSDQSIKLIILFSVYPSLLVAMEDSNDNYEIFKDCVSATVLSNSTRRPTTQAKKRVARGLGGSPATMSRSSDNTPSDISAGGDDAVELAEFIEVASTSTSGAEWRI
jgi:hypothetical protein